MFPWSHRSQTRLEEEFQAHIDHPAFPCVGAKAALARGNLAEALAPYGVAPDQIPVAFNCLVNVPVETSGRIRVLPPVSKADDHISFRAEMDFIIGLTACSAPASNGGSFKPIHYYIETDGS